MPLSQPHKLKGQPSAGEFTFIADAEGSVVLQPQTPVVPDLINLTPEARKVLGALRKAGGRPLVVGGSVRDALLARETGEQVESKDIDIEVHGLDVQKVADAIPGELNMVGKSFRVFTTRINGRDFDISLPRCDSRTGDGHRDFDVELDRDITLEEAFARRDWDDQPGELIDTLNGRADLEARILRDTSEHFQDDALRVLRGMTFAGRFGMGIAPETAALRRKMAPRFASLPKERLWKQFHGPAAKGTRISKALTPLHDSGWEDQFPGLDATRGVPQDPRWHREGDVIVHLGLAGDEAARIAQTSLGVGTLREG